MFANTNFSRRSAVQRNLIRILFAIEEAGEITQSDLIDTLGLATGAVSTLLKRLTDVGVVEAENLRPGGRGRPQRLLRLGPSSFVVAGAQITRSAVIVCVQQLNGTEIGRKTIEVSGARIDSLGPAIRDALSSLLEDNPTACHLLSIVVGFPGIGDNDVLRSIEMGWEAEPVETMRDTLTQAFNVGILIENDGQLATLAEWSSQPNPKCDNVAVVLVESGIGGGIVAGGQLLQQPPSWPGLGHSPVIHDGARCLCGNRGCLETVASLAAIEGVPLTSFGSPEAEDTAEVVRRILARAIDGDPETLDRMSLAAAGLATLADTTAALIGTERIILTGTGGRLAPWLTPEVLSGRSSKIVRGTHGTDAVITGALLQSKTYGLLAAAEIASAS